jgi:hypothetical protein
MRQAILLIFLLLPCSQGVAQQFSVSLQGGVLAFSELNYWIDPVKGNLVDLALPPKPEPSPLATASLHYHFRSKWIAGVEMSATRWRSRYNMPTFPGSETSVEATENFAKPALSMSITLNRQLVSWKQTSLWAGPTASYVLAVNRQRSLEISNPGGSSRMTNTFPGQSSAACGLQMRIEHYVSPLWSTMLQVSGQYHRLDFGTRVPEDVAILRSFYSYSATLGIGYWF